MVNRLTDAPVNDISNLFITVLLGKDVIVEHSLRSCHTFKWDYWEAATEFCRRLRKLEGAWELTS